jgi:hypothetical protein
MSTLAAESIASSAFVTRSISLAFDSAKKICVSELRNISVDRCDRVKIISASPGITVPRKLLINVPMTC